MPTLRDAALFAILIGSVVSVGGLLFVTVLSMELMEASESTAVTIESLRVTKDQNDDTAMVHVAFLMENPTSISLKIVRMEYRFFVDDVHVWTGYEFPDDNELSSRGTISIDDEVEFPLYRIPLDESGGWQVTGTVWFESSITGRFKLTFEDSTTNIDRR